MIFLESQHKGEFAIQIGNYFQRLELLLFVFAALNLHNENYAHTHTHTHTPEKYFICFDLVITFLNTIVIVSLQPIWHL